MAADKWCKWNDLYKLMASDDDKDVALLPSGYEQINDILHDCGHLQLIQYSEEVHQASDCSKFYRTTQSGDALGITIFNNKESDDSKKINQVFTFDSEKRDGLYNAVIEYYHSWEATYANMQRASNAKLSVYRVDEHKLGIKNEAKVAYNSLNHEAGKYIEAHRAKAILKSGQFDCLHISISNPNDTSNLFRTSYLIFDSKISINDDARFIQKVGYVYLYDARLMVADKIKAANFVRDGIFLSGKSEDLFQELSETNSYHQTLVAHIILFIIRRILISLELRLRILHAQISSLL